MVKDEKAVKRGIELLRVAAGFVAKHDLESLEIEYDGTTCDGGVLAEDCLAAAETLEEQSGAGQ